MVGSLRLVEKKPNYRTILLRNPYDVWHMPGAVEFFVGMVGLKISGYSTRHRDGALPLDTTDFVANHLILADESADGLRLLSALKIITADECQRFNVPFSALQVALGAAAPDHATVVKNLLENCARDKKPLSYVSSWTIAPAIRENRVLSAEVRDIAVSLVVNYHQDENIEDVIACGIPRVKSDRTVRLMGLKPLCKDGVELPGIRQSSLQHEEVVMMAATGFSEEAKELGRIYRSLWETRRTIDKTAEQKQAA